MRTTTLFLTALLLAAQPLHASGLVAERLFLDDAGNVLPAGKVVVRVFWQADDPADQLVGVVGSPTNPMSISVNGGTFFDSDHFAAGDRPPFFGILGLPGFEELSYDTWFTIGNTSIDIGPDWPSGKPFSDQVIIAPGTSFDAGGGAEWIGGPGGPDFIAWTTPPGMEEPGGHGGVQLTPQTVAGNWPGDRIAILQLVVDPSPGPGGVSMMGTMGLLLVEDGLSQEISGSFSFPAPSALFALVLGSLTGTRRRSR